MPASTWEKLVRLEKSRIDQSVLTEILEMYWNNYKAADSVSAMELCIDEGNSKEPNSRKICTYIRNGELCSVYAAWVLWAVRKNNIMPCFAWRWIACSTALRGKRQSHLRARPAYPKGITLSAGFTRTLIWFWIGMSWSMVSMNHRKNAQTPNRMPSIKMRTQKLKFSWQKLSARRSDKVLLLYFAFHPILFLPGLVRCR